MASELAPSAPKGAPRRCVKDVFVVQTAIGDYRDQFLAEVSRECGERVRFASGSEYFYPSLRRSRTASVSFLDLENRFFFGRRLLWQFNAVRPALAARTCVFELNPRILSNWLILVVRTVLGRKSIAWGHAWSRRGPAARSDLVRRLMRSLASSIIVYTETQAEELRARMPRTHVVAAPNAVVRSAEMEPLADPARPARAFTLIGRLVSEKKPQLAVEAFAAVRQAGLMDAVLNIVGDGPARTGLEQEVKALEIASQVIFHGHVADLNALRRIYADTVCTLSPGYVGLSITQSLGFGVPMIIARREPHSPEIEAAREGFSAFFVNSDDVVGLAEAMIRCWEDRAAITARAEELVRFCRDRYSVEAMVAGFLAGVA